MLSSLQPIPPGVPVLHKLKLKESLLLRFSNWKIGLQELPLRDSITEVKGLLNLLELFYQDPLAGMIRDLCFKHTSS